MSAAFVVKQPCTDCSQFFYPAELTRVGESVYRCQRCRERHTIAIENFDATPPKECPMCRRSLQELERHHGGKLVRWFLVMKDGIYQLLCESCERVYVEKRADLFAKTRFGWNRKLR